MAENDCRRQEFPRYGKSVLSGDGTASVDQIVDAMAALDDDKLPAEDRIENAKENATKTLKNLAEQAQWRAQYRLFMNRRVGGPTSIRHLEPFCLPIRLIGRLTPQHSWCGGRGEGRMGV